MPVEPRLVRPAARLALFPPRISAESRPERRLWWQNTWRRLAEKADRPRFGRWAALLLPVMLLVPLGRYLGGPAAPSAAQEQTQGGEGLLGELREAVARRAAIRLEDDFRSGLGAWQGAADWADSWSYDEAGFVRPGKLALWEPSLGLSDYRMEFLAQIERGGASWVYRARDLRNHYAATLMLAEEGPSIRAVLLRQTVIEGRAAARERVPLPVVLSRVSLRRVSLEARGDAFSLYVDGQLVSHWRDRRLSSGGIGFYVEPGARYRLRGVVLTNQDDWLGRFCAWLAPPAGDPRQRSSEKP